MRTKHKQIGLPAGKWEPLFKKAGIEKEKLETTKSEQARKTIIGNFLAQSVGREVPMDTNGQTGKAVLRMASGRSKAKRYWFDVTWDTPQSQTTDTAKRKKTAVKDHAPGKTGGKKVRAHEEEQRGRKQEEDCEEERRYEVRSQTRNAWKRRAVVMRQTRDGNGGPWPGGGPLKTRSTTEVHHI